MEQSIRQVVVVHGAPGTGKTTVAAQLHERLRCPWFEFGWIPEFCAKNPHTEIPAQDEEQLSFENLVLVTKNYFAHGFGRVLLSDLNDVRLLDLPTVFGHNYVIFTLETAEAIQRKRILTRDNGNSYRDCAQAAKILRKISGRPPLPNEYRLDSMQQTPDALTDQILELLERHKATSVDGFSAARANYFSYLEGQ
ncbi:MAG: hypothetical protein LBJ11_02695 [Oscillospiraceae bacterium]|jgi:dephospho-CoA kinase|nr:hypothetical protein [Oscillospiraceae bacterium]